MRRVRPTKVYRMLLEEITLLRAQLDHHKENVVQFLITNPTNQSRGLLLELVDEHQFRVPTTSADVEAYLLREGPRLDRNMLRQRKARGTVIEEEEPILPEELPPIEETDPEWEARASQALEEAKRELERLKTE